MKAWTKMHFSLTGDQEIPMIWYNFTSPAVTMQNLSVSSILRRNIHTIYSLQFVHVHLKCFCCFFFLIRFIFQRPCYEHIRNRCSIPDLAALDRQLLKAKWIRVSASGHILLFHFWPQSPWMNEEIQTVRILYSPWIANNLYRDRGTC